ncbi:hypothetical protein AVEN_50556-1 [Araneus ventricosus]|uniref:Uncharacterized protein n=1 Tax=Araneus ventricosus TaxID=182803 RepID=A0A4Y2AS18_ARAVE|nr:hypothetical protein AVEN_50556-1 [Araneus ventricosus]
MRRFSLLLEKKCNDVIVLATFPPLGWIGTWADDGHFVTDHSTCFITAENECQGRAMVILRVSSVLLSFGFTGCPVARVHIYKPYPDRTEAGNQSISLATRSSDVVFSSRT